MSRYLKYVFPSVDTQAVTYTQTLTAPGNLTLNGNLADSIHSKVSFMTNGYCRSVSLTSVNDLSVATFTVSGIQNGVFVTEDITGPNNNTVYGLNYYDIITSISVDRAVALVSVGSGLIGFFALINIDPNLGDVNYSLTLTSNNNANQIPTAIWGTNDNIALNGITYIDNTTNNYSLIAIKTINAVTQYILPVPPVAGNSVYLPLYTSLLINLVGTNTTRNNSMTLIFIQI